MRAPLTYLETSRRQPLLEARAIAMAEGQRPEVIIALLAAVVFWMVAPAVVVGLFALDSDILAGARGLIQGVSPWLSYLTLAPAALALPMAAMVARANEDL